MELKTVEKVLEVFGRRSNYHWYNWGEPLLYNHFHEFVQMTRRYRTSISSNFSLRISDQTFEDLSKITQVTVSMSGITKETYQHYHRGGNFDLVWSNVQRLIGYPNVVRINYLVHPWNQHEVGEAKEWCEKCGFVWGGLRGNCEVEECLEGGFESPFMKSPRYYSSKHFEFCKVQRWVPIDVDGNYMLCCTSHNVPIGYTIWDNLTPEEIRQAKMSHPMCKECYAKGCWRMF